MAPFPGNPIPSSLNLSIPYFKGGCVMRKKTVLRAIAIVTCLAIISLSVPTVAVAKERPDKFTFKSLFLKQLRILGSLFPFLNIDVDDDPTPKQSKISKTSNDAPKNLKKITGTLNSVQRPEDD